MFDVSDLQAEGGKEENLFTIMKHARPWWFILFVATSASIINGIVFPAFRHVLMSLIIINIYISVFSSPR